MFSKIKINSLLIIQFTLLKLLLIPNDINLVNGQQITNDDHSICLKYFAKFNRDHTACVKPNPRCKVIKFGISEEEKKLILDVHNYYRNLIASGNESGLGFPSAANMLTLEWDDELAYVAQKHANQCRFEHDCYDCRRTERYPVVGQNLYTYRTTRTSVEPQWRKTIKEWYDEIKIAPPQVAASFDLFQLNIGHFTQIAWAETNRIGCGYTTYLSTGGNPIFKTEQLYTCNYAPGGNYLGEKMYENGVAASKCPSQYGPGRQFHALCEFISWSTNSNSQSFNNRFQNSNTNNNGDEQIPPAVSRSGGNNSNDANSSPISATTSTTSTTTTTTDSTRNTGTNRRTTGTRNTSRTSTTNNSRPSTTTTSTTTTSTSSTNRNRFRTNRKKNTNLINNNNDNNRFTNTIGSTGGQTRWSSRLNNWKNNSTGSSSTSSTWNWKWNDSGYDWKKWLTNYTQFTNWTQWSPSNNNNRNSNNNFNNNLSTRSTLASPTTTTNLGNNGNGNNYLTNTNSNGGNNVPWRLTNVTWWGNLTHTTNNFKPNQQRQSQTITTRLPTYTWSLSLGYQRDNGNNNIQPQWSRSVDLTPNNLNSNLYRSQRQYNYNNNNFNSNFNNRFNYY